MLLYIKTCNTNLLVKTKTLMLSKFNPAFTQPSKISSISLTWTVLCEWPHWLVRRRNNLSTNQLNLKKKKNHSYQSTGCLYTFHTQNLCVSRDTENKYSTGHKQKPDYHSRTAVFACWTGLYSKSVSFTAVNTVFILCWILNTPSYIKGIWLQYDKACNGQSTCRLRSILLCPYGVNKLAHFTLV